MSIKRTFNGATIIKPGAFTKLIVENLTGFPLQPTGTVGIIGEAVGGEPGVLDILSKEGIQSAKARYKSGPIADALELLANPSRDPRIANGASKIVVFKTNNGTRSGRILANNAVSPISMLDLKSKNYGADENQLSVAISQGAILDANAKLLGTVVGPYTVALTDTLKLFINGTLYTYTSGVVGSQTAVALVADLNTALRWAPSKPVIASVVAGKVCVEIDAVALPLAALDYGSVEVDVTCTLDTILGITGENRGVKGSRILLFEKGTLTEASLELGGVPQISVVHIGAGVTCTLTLQKVSGEIKLTSVSSVPAENLNIVLQDVEGRNKFTLKSLVDSINATGFYSAAVLGPNPMLNADKLDYYNAVEIKNVAANLNKDILDIVDYLNTFSTLASATRLDNVYGALKLIVSPVFFSAGTDGVSANSDFANGFEAFKEERINCVVPLISTNVGALTIDSINALAAAHAAYGWSTIGKSERQIFGSFLGSKTAFKDAAKKLNSGYFTLVGQDVRVLDKNSNLNWLDPWAFACVLAGLRAGAEVGEPLTSKVINVNNIRVRDGSWNPRKDFAEMIEAGCTFAEPMDAGGFRVVVGNTTYVTDGSFVFNRESVVQAAGFVAYDLRLNLDAAFTGNKARTGTAEAIANFIKNRMSTYLAADIIVGDDLNEGLGYNAKSLSVRVEGNSAIINVSITPVQGIDFILATIFLADIRQSA